MKYKVGMLVRFNNGDEPMCYISDIEPAHIKLQNSFENEFLWRKRGFEMWFQVVTDVFCS